MVVIEDSDEPAFVHVKIDSENYYQSTEVACRNVDEFTVAKEGAIRLIEGAQQSLEALTRVAARVNHKALPALHRATGLVEDGAATIKAT